MTLTVPFPTRLASSALLLTALLAGCAQTETKLLGRSLRDLPILIPPRTIGLSGELIEPPARPIRGHIDFAQMPDQDIVQLHLLPSFYARRWAFHPAFITYRAEAGRWDKWEVWADQPAAYDSKEITGRKRFSDGREEVKFTYHQHRYGTIRKTEGVTHFYEHLPEQVRASWSGAEAARILDVLEQPEDYPWIDTYRIWPGPNSNTYATWVLEQAGIGLDLGPKLVGKDWRTLFGAGAGLSPTRTGLRFDLPGLGATLGLKDGAELHLLGATFGLDLWPPALKTPAGRLGFSEY